MTSRSLTQRLAAPWQLLALTASLTLGFAPESAAADHHADDKASHAKAAKPVEEKAEAKGPEHKAARATGAPSQAKEEESVDQLRERLAQKLAAAKPQIATPAATSMRVVAKVDPAVAPAHAQAHGATSPAHGSAHVVATAVRPGAAAPHAPSLAAAHRATKGQTGHAAPGGHAHWSYQGEGGPEAWGQMQPEFATCATGQRQSPIDIRGGVRVELEPVKFDYRPSRFAVIDNGHTIQVNVDQGNSIAVMGRRYNLLQFHFHRPSEERIDGRQFDMVAHLVHKDPDGRLAVVAVLLDRGSVHPLVQTVWNNLPLEKGDEVRVASSLDLNQLLPQDQRYYTYMGSLTTPPCSEGVMWIVMSQPVGISADQIAVFSHLYPMNARPIQSMSGRLIKAPN